MEKLGRMAKGVYTPKVNFSSLCSSDPTESQTTQYVSTNDLVRETIHFLEEVPITCWDTKVIMLF